MTTRTAHDVRRLVSLIRRQFIQPDIPYQLWRLLAQRGDPISVEDLSAAAGWSEQDVRAEFQRQPGTDWDEWGRIAGFGLTLRPTPHKFTFDGRTVYGFCASDTLDLPTVLNQPGVAESSCPTTGQRIRVQLTPTMLINVDPGPAVVSRIRPDEALDDIRRQLCDLGHFYSSPEAAVAWQTAHPEGEVVPVHEEFAVVRQAMIELGWAAQH